MGKVELNGGQQAAVDAIRSGQNVFLTGEGGTGKSVAIGEAVRFLRKDKRKVVLCAPTGVAAQNVGGATVHSVFNFDLAPKVADALRKVHPSKVIREADVVIIDEIGMVRRDLMDAIALVILKENETRSRMGGRSPLQLVAVGDFSQLPPVVTSSDKPALVAQYGPASARTGFYAFEADGWGLMGFKVCQLTEPMRQSDPTFVSMLNLARMGDDSCLPYFNDLAGRDDVPDEAVSIVARNKDADTINLAHLKTLGGETESYRATVSGDYRCGDMPAPEVLELKERARVIFVAGDWEEGYVNGSTGTVVGLEPDEVLVELDDGGTVAVKRKRWENFTYEVVEGMDGETKLEQDVKGTFTQFPLKLAWAITYHKSQGQTLEAIALDPSTFGAGMLYVGLSRATTADGIWLTKRITPSNLKADKSVVKFCQDGYEWQGDAAALPQAVTPLSNKPNAAADAPISPASNGKAKPKRPVTQDASTTGLLEHMAKMESEMAKLQTQLATVQEMLVSLGAVKPPAE